MAISLSSEKFTALLEHYVREAVAEFQRRIRAAGLILTGEMLEAFEIKALQAAPAYISQQVEMAGYFRIKDLRSMHYARMPPQAAMEYFIEKTGLSKFAYVPGYKGSSPSSDTIAMERIAWGIRAKRLQNPDVKRGYRGIYNEIMGSGLAALRSAVGQAGARLAIQEFQSAVSGNL